MALNRYALKLTGLFLFVLVCGILLGWFLRKNWEEPQDAASAGREVREGAHEFINPLLTCGDMGSEISKEIIPFRHVVQEKIDELVEDRKAKLVSVYFRDLDNGPWFGIGERNLFSPSSLLKVPTLIGWLKEAENNPEILQKKIVYAGDNFNANVNEIIRAATEAEYGKTYTVEELLHLMIVYSDNNSTLLLGNIGWPFSEKVYNVMGLPQPSLVAGDYQITVKNYAAFFRLLYNASYLNQKMSNRALNMLASVDFKRGLVAGVPEGIKVAHKFGENTSQDENQLHDCGIVYYPKQPYLLCVMTRGADMEDLITVVSSISKLVFDEVDRQYKGKALP